MRGRRFRIPHSPFRTPHSALRKCGVRFRVIRRLPFLQPPCVLGIWLAVCPRPLAGGEPPASANSPTNSPTHDQVAPKVLTASIYSHDGRAPRLLYRFKRLARESGPNIVVLREFSYPDGKLAAREKVVYRNGSLRDFQLDELQTGGAGRAWVEPDPKNPGKLVLAFQYSASRATLAVSPTRHEALAADTLVSDTVGPFLAAHWAQLQAGQGVRCQYVVIPRRETIGFSFKRDSESTWHGRPVLILKMRPTSRVLSALVDPLYFTVEKDPPHRVLQYVGRTTPKRLEGSRWKDLDALTVFDW